MTFDVDYICCIQCTWFHEKLHQPVKLSFCWSKVVE